MLQLMLYRWLYLDPVPSTTTSSRSLPERRHGARRNTGGRVTRLRHQARSCLDFGIKSTLPPSMDPALTCLLLDFPVSLPRLHPSNALGSTIACFILDAVVHCTSVCLSAFVYPNSSARSNASSAARKRRMQRLEAEVGNLVNSIVSWVTGRACLSLPQQDLFNHAARKLAAASFWRDSDGAASRADYPKLVLEVEDQPRQRRVQQLENCQLRTNALPQTSEESGLEVSNRRAGKPSTIPSSPRLPRAYPPSISAPICREEVRRHPLAEWTNHRQGGEPTAFKV